MFRPCIDLHEGRVKQIVGGTLSDHGPGPRTNFVAEQPAGWFADLYRQDNLRGGHIIMLGGGNEAAAREALAAWPGGLQIGGGINLQNAATWLEAGASHVIVTSFVFRDGRLDWDRLGQLTALVGRKRLVLDLSCRIRDGQYFVVTDRWQKFTDLVLNRATLETLSPYCDEFLVHAVDVEGLCQGVDLGMVKLLAETSNLPTTYAGGAKTMADLESVTAHSGGKIDLTIGSALDIFGGSGVNYADAVAFNKKLSPKP